MQENSDYARQYMSAEQTSGVSLEEKRAKAIAYLGPKYINHPQYRFDTRHSNHKELYLLARQLFLAGIAQLAKRDREANPLYQRNLRVQEAFSQ